MISTARHSTQKYTKHNKQNIINIHGMRTNVLPILTQYKELETMQFTDIKHLWAQIITIQLRKPTTYSKYTAHSVPTVTY